MTQAECRDTVRACRDRAKKSKAHLELNLARDAKGNKKGFCGYIRSQRKKCGPAPESGRRPGDQDIEKVKVLNAFFTSVFTGEVPVDWKKANVSHIFKKGKKEYLGNYRPVSLTLIPAGVVEQIILKTISKHIKDKKLRPVTSGVPQGLILGPVLLNIFINDPEDGTEHTFYRTGRRSLYTRGEVCTPEARAAIQRHLGRLEKCADRNHTKFSKRKGKSLCLGSVLAMSSRVWAGGGCGGDRHGKRLWTALCQPQVVPNSSGTSVSTLVCTRTSGSQSSPQGLSSYDLGNRQLQGDNSPMHQHRLRAIWLQNRLAQEDLGVLVDTKETLKQQCTLAAKKANALGNYNPQDNLVIRPSQQGFMKGRSCLTNLISFYDKVTRSVDEGKAVDVVYLDFSKAFDTVSHSILLEKLAAHGLDGRTLCWVKNWLHVRAQRVVVNGVKSSWQPVTSSVPQGSILGTSPV
ncbi:hypothetical protein QYF61_023116 [Mycteria americana]|uniref:Reverse transcriptase domain-containing protein n=1 Tax=Mycteria americana TaxID=33587 RepID=A0AAN7NNH1_MYCAM|nr:hypothetical protein QYF61_023116 [Mycteria americana]